MLHLWERETAKALLKARTITRKEIDRLLDMGLSHGANAQLVDDMDGIVELITEALARVDPEVQLMWRD